MAEKRESQKAKGKSAKAKVGGEEEESTSTSRRTSTTKSEAGRQPSSPDTRHPTPETSSAWVEEKTLGARPGRFAWRVDAKGELVVRWRLGTKRMSREELSRLTAFMGDGHWHPASETAADALEGVSAMCIERFLHDELGWRGARPRLSTFVGLVMASAGLWEWNGLRRGMQYLQVSRDLGMLGVHCDERRTTGAPCPVLSRSEEPKLHKREGGPRFSLCETFRSLSRAMRARFETCGAGRHEADKGQRRESALREFLRAQLPGRYGVTRGEAIASLGEASRQADVLVYDALCAPVLLATDASMLLAAESVYAAIEVKPNLRVHDLKTAVRNIASVKSLSREAIVRSMPPRADEPRENPVPFGAVFAFTSDAPARLLDKLVALHAKLHPSLWVDCVCILDRAVIHRFGFAPGPIGWSPEFATLRTPLACIGAGADSLLLFYLLLCADLNAKTLRPPDLLHYAAGMELGDWEAR